jgi:hypothetical protein
MKRSVVIQAIGGLMFVGALGVLAGPVWAVLVAGALLVLLGTAAEAGWL